MTRAYYNDSNPGAAAWLRELIAEGHIAPGDVDERSIADVQAKDLDGYTQVHLFAGIGGWSFALRLAGWPDDRAVWTGSCPCQPFSAAGKRGGTADARHLWPEMFRLVRECRPPVVFGEQVASAEVVGGASGANQAMQQVLDREAVLGVLCELQGQSTPYVRRVPGVRQGEQAEEPRIGVTGTSAMETGESWPCSCECGEAQGQDSGDGVLFGQGRHPETDRRGGVRGHGDCVRPQLATGVERAIVGPDRLIQGIHAEEHPRRALCPQCGGQRLGRELDIEDCLSDPRAAEGEIKRLVESFGIGAAKIPDRWLDRVFADLEAEKYACGAVVLGAHSVGAPHIRQRLWWVADAAVDGREGLQRCVATQVSEDWTPKTLDAWHGVGDPFADWKKLLAGTCVRRMDDGVSSGLFIRPSLRCFGNAIVPQVAAAFVTAYMEGGAA